MIWPENVPGSSEENVMSMESIWPAPIVAVETDVVKGPSMVMELTSSAAEPGLLIVTDCVEGEPTSVLKLMVDGLRTSAGMGVWFAMADADSSIVTAVLVGSLVVKDSLPVNEPSVCGSKETINDMSLPAGMVAEVGFIEKGVPNDVPETIRSELPIFRMVKPCVADVPASIPVQDRDVVEGAAAG